MSARTGKPAPPPAYVDEDDVDLGRYGRAIAARWWLPVLGLIAGAILGYLISLGGTALFRGQATIYLGQPYSPNGNNPVNGPQSNPSSVRQIVTSDSVIQRVASLVGEKPGQLRGNISTSAVSGNVVKLNQAPLVTITVTGKAPKKVRLAANELANTAVIALGGYARAKITTLKEQIASDDTQLTAIDRAVRSGNATTNAVLEIQRGTVQTDRLAAIQLVSQAKQIESPRVLTRAAANKTTARTRRSTAAVAAVIGLLLGLVAALLWEPVASRVGRAPRV